MLFLSSPRGVGIAPTIELSVVIGTDVPLLSLPHFHGFRTNESQHPSCSLPDQAQMGCTDRHRERSMADARYGHCNCFNVPLRRMNAPPCSVMLV